MATVTAEAWDVGEEALHRRSRNATQRADRPGARFDFFDTNAMDIARGRTFSESEVHERRPGGMVIGLGRRRRPLSPTSRPSGRKCGIRTGASRSSGS